MSASRWAVSPTSSRKRQILLCTMPSATRASAARATERSSRTASVNRSQAFPPCRGPWTACGIPSIPAKLDPRMNLISRISIAAIGAAVVMGVGAQTRAPFASVTDAMLQNPDPADWLMWRRTLNSWGYSPLDQINKSNVSRLKMVWSRGMGPGIQEATPLVYRGVMYLPHPSDFIEAMNAATGEVLWEYKRTWPEEVTQILRAPSINRNLAIYANNIIDTSGDDFVFALNAQTGELSW